jgi:hypothetical protein
MKKSATAMIVFAIVIGLIAEQVWADEIDRCRLPLPAGFAERSFPDDLPAELRKVLQERFGEIASPGAPFNSTDVHFAGRPNRRAMFAWTNGRRWVIATELGALFTDDPVWAFDVSPDGSAVALVKQLDAFSIESACSSARELATHY